MSQYKRSMQRMLGLDFSENPAAPVPSTTTEVSKVGSPVSFNEVMQQDTPVLAAAEEGANSTVDKQNMLDGNFGLQGKYSNRGAGDGSSEIALFFHQYKHDVLSFVCIVWICLFTTNLNRESLIANVHMTLLGESGLLDFSVAIGDGD